MDIDSVYRIYNDYRKLNEISSLPYIVVNSDGSKLIRWFNYDIVKEDDSSAVIEITGRYEMDSGLNVREHSLNEVKELELGDFDEPELSERDYFEKLEKLYDSPDREQMKELLRKAEVVPLLCLYEIME